MIHDYDTDESTPEHFRCRHIHVDGRRCASPCLRTQPFCYYHHTHRSPVSAADRQSRRRRSGFTLPSPAELADRSGIQLAIGTVLQRIASNQLDPRRAGLLLYGLQIASSTLAKDNARPKLDDFVEDIVEDPALGTVATESEMHFTESGRKSPVRQLAEMWAKRKREQKEGLDLQASAAPRSTSLRSKLSKNRRSQNSPTQNSRRNQTHRLAARKLAAQQAPNPKPKTLNPKPVHKTLTRHSIRTTPSARSSKARQLEAQRTPISAAGAGCPMSRF